MIISTKKKSTKQPLILMSSTLFGTSEVAKLFLNPNNFEATITTYDSGGSVTDTITHGPFSGWIPHFFTVRQYDGDGRLIWTRLSDYYISVWSIDMSDLSQLSYKTYRPFAGWNLCSIYNRADNTNQFVWVRYSDGLTSLWEVDADENFVSESLISPKTFRMIQIKEPWTKTEIELPIGVDSSEIADLT